MGRQKTYEGVNGLVQATGERKGYCSGCKEWMTLKETFTAFQDPFDRDPTTGQLRSVDELQEAVDELAARWSNGPVLHHKCALVKTDVLAGFDIDTGKYSDVASNIAPLQFAATG